MKIIIIGAGQVGGTLAENLVGEQNDITLIDTNSETLRELQDKMDLRVITGHGSHPDVLKQAGAEDAELIVAVTNDDATNMIACAPEQLVTRDIARLIDYPGALQVLEFAEGKVSLVAVKAYYGGLLVGHALSTLREHIPNIDTRVAAIYRNGKPIRPLGTTVIEADDEVFFIAE